MYEHGMSRNKFEQSLEALSSYETHEAQSLMTEALEAMDMMNNAIVLQNEVCLKLPGPFAILQMGQSDMHIGDKCSCHIKGMPCARHSHNIAGRICVTA